MTKNYNNFYSNWRINQLIFNRDNFTNVFPEYNHQNALRRLQCKLVLKYLRYK
jgi:hypothetical protein